MLQQSPMVPSLNLAYATLTPFSWSLIAFWHTIARPWRPCRTLIELPRPPPETSTNIAKFDPLFFSKKTGGQNPSKEDVLWTNGFGVAARGARKFYEISQAVYKMTFWPSLQRHKQNYGWQMHFINQTHLQFSSSPRIVPASSQIITNPRNLLKIVAWLEWRNEIHLRYSCEWKLCWKDPPWRGLEPRENNP